MQPKPKQMPLFQNPRTPRSMLLKEDLRDPDRGNRVAARVILENPQRYAGLPVEWAKRWQGNRKENL